MAIRFDAYTATGVRRGTVDADGRLGDLLETLDQVRVTGGVIVPLDGSPATPDPSGGTNVPTDELLIVVAPPETPMPVHPAWHDVVLRAGPYVVVGRMPTMPGFDPARALARPTGTFVLLGNVRLTLTAAPTSGAVEHALAWVNRYVVERVEADIELGFFFPGAESKVTNGFTAEAAGLRPEAPVVVGPAVGPAA